MTDRMRILLVHERFPPDYAGGGEYVVLETARALQNAGHQVQVLTAGNPVLTSFAGIATQRLPMSRYRFNGAWRQVLEAAQDVDLIHCFSYHAAWPAWLAGQKLGKPVVLGVLALFGDTWLEMRGALLGRLFRALERRQLSLPMAARIYLSGESLALARTLKLEQATDVIIAPGISLADYHATPDKPYVMYAGKLDVRKGIDIVIEVARSLPDVPFRLIGWGERYDEIAAQCPPNATLEPFQDRLHLASALSGARLFLFPTKAETFGLIVAEAMASGCALVSSSALPFAGIRIAPSDSKAACQAVRTLWDDPLRCAEAAASNIAQAQAYSWEVHLTALCRLYRNVLGRPA